MGAVAFSATLLVETEGKSCGFVVAGSSHNKTQHPHITNTQSSTSRRRTTRRPPLNNKRKRRRQKSPKTCFFVANAEAYQVIRVLEENRPLRHAGRVLVVDEERVDAVRAVLLGAVVAAVASVAVAGQALNSLVCGKETRRAVRREGSRDDEDVERLQEPLPTSRLPGSWCASCVSMVSGSACNSATRHCSSSCPDITGCLDGATSLGFLTWTKLKSVLK